MKNIQLFKKRITVTIYLYDFLERKENRGTKD